MSLQGKNKGWIDLERDMTIIPEDTVAMRRPEGGENSHDLSEYLYFLEAIGAFATRKTEVKIYKERFE